MAPLLCGLVKLDDVRAIQYGDVLVEGERWPNCIHVIEHPDGRVLVDTGMIDSTPSSTTEWGIRFDPDLIPRDVVCVINTHLHFDHCGGNRLFPARRSTCSAPSSRPRASRTTRSRSGSSSTARRTSSTTARRRSAGVRCSRRPGHTPGHQSVLVDTDDGLVVLGGDVGYTVEAVRRERVGDSCSCRWGRGASGSRTEAEPRDLQ